MSVFKKILRTRTGAALIDAAGQPRRADTYSYKFDFKGKQISVATHFTDKEQAERAEGTHRKLLAAGQVEAARALLQRRPASEMFATIGDVLKAYLASDVEAGADARDQNVKALRRALRLVRGGTDDDNDQLPFSVINPDFIKDYFQAWTRKADACVNGESTSKKKSANSDARKFASIWTARALEYYERHGHKVQDFRPVELAIESRRFKGKAVKSPYIPPDQALIDRTIAAWLALTDRDMFLAIGHELAFGLRKSEVQSVRWNWHKVVDGAPCLSSGAELKDDSGYLLVKALDPFYTHLMARVEKEGWRGAPGDLLINGTATYRTETLYNDISAWMRSQALGWTTQKTNHVFRKYAGSLVAMRWDIYEASRWLRHSSVLVTQQHYTDYVQRFTPEDKTKVGCSWAKAEPVAFVPVIVPAAAV